MKKMIAIKIFVLTESGLHEVFEVEIEEEKRTSDPKQWEETIDYFRNKIYNMEIFYSKRGCCVINDMSNKTIVVKGLFKDYLGLPCKEF